jgi:sulfatase modifying factor 1
MRAPANSVLLSATLLFVAVTAPAQTRVGNSNTEPGFVLVPKGRYQVGKDDSRRNPLRMVQVDSFLIAIYETTNRQFAAFVAATGYVTDAEKRHNAMVFEPGLPEFRWIRDSSAYWRFPNGVTRGGIEKRMDHPVTCISYRDGQAYCAWARVRLPTLEEWEIACRAGSKTDYFFGASDERIGEYANIWHGHDHMHSDHGDPYLYTAPVGSFKPNAWGLYDMYGNVFEFCSGKVFADESHSLAHARGGSWWCSKNACHSFNSYSIGQANVHASFSNQGFRVVKVRNRSVRNGESNAHPDIRSRE